MEKVDAKAPAQPGLRVVQHAIALEFGYSGWAALKNAVHMFRFEILANDMVAAYGGDAWEPYMEALKNVCDAMNNDQAMFVLPPPQ